MMLVRIIKKWDTPDLFRQTPHRCGKWKNIQFTADPVRACDYVIVCNWTTEEYTVSVPKENVWCVLQEPPNEVFAPRHGGHPVYAKIFTQDVRKRGERYVLSPPALPWHVGKDYDYLVSVKPPQKSKVLSWITSNKAQFAGHKKRLEFLSQLRKKVDFDLYGYGFNTVVDKWEGLAPYRYSLAVENYSGPNYWSEKLADCFLSWTVPIYYGCTNITEYFPEESVIRIDIEDPDCMHYVKDIIKGNEWKKRREAVAYARHLLLEKYHFFPFFAEKIRQHHKKTAGKTTRQQITIPDQNTLIEQAKQYVFRLTR